MSSCNNHVALFQAVTKVKHGSYFILLALRKCGKQRAITRANADPNLCGHVVSLGDNELNSQKTPTQTTFTHAQGGCGVEAGGFWYSRSATAGMFTHTRSGRGAGADAGGPAISWGQWWFGARGFEVDVANWVLDPFLAERILLPLRLRSATAHVWTHLMICVEANFPPARACVNVPSCWSYKMSQLLSRIWKIYVCKKKKRTLDSWPLLFNGVNTWKS